MVSLGRSKMVQGTLKENVYLDSISESPFHHFVHTVRRPRPNKHPPFFQPQKAPI